MEFLSEKELSFFPIIMSIFYFYRKLRCVCFEVNIHNSKNPKNKRMLKHTKRQQPEQSSDMNSESECEDGTIGRGRRGRFFQMKKRFTKMTKTSREGGAVRVTDYHEMAPQYLYTSLPQDETPDEETQQNKYEEIPVGRWYNAVDSSDYSSDEADVVGMKLYQDAPVTYHRTSAYDGQTF